MRRAALVPANCTRMYGYVAPPARTRGIVAPSARYVEVALARAFWRSGRGPGRPGGVYFLALGRLAIEQAV